MKRFFASLVLAGWCLCSSVSAGCVEFALLAWPHGLPENATSFRLFSTVHGWSNRYFFDEHDNYFLFMVDVGPDYPSTVSVFVFDQYSRTMGRTRPREIRDCMGTALIPIERMIPVEKNP